MLILILLFLALTLIITFMFTKYRKQIMYKLKQKFTLKAIIIKVITLIIVITISLNLKPLIVPTLEEFWRMSNNSYVVLNNLNLALDLLPINVKEQTGTILIISFVTYLFQTITDIIVIIISSSNSEKLILYNNNFNYSSNKNGLDSSSTNIDSNKNTLSMTNSDSNLTSNTSSESSTNTASASTSKEITETDNPSLPNTILPEEYSNLFLPNRDPVLSIDKRKIDDVDSSSDEFEELNSSNEQENFVNKKLKVDGEFNPNTVLLKEIAAVEESPTSISKGKRKLEEDSSNSSESSSDEQEKPLSSVALGKRRMDTVEADDENPKKNKKVKINGEFNSKESSPDKSDTTEAQSNPSVNNSPRDSDADSGHETDSNVSLLDNFVGFSNQQKIIRLSENLDRAAYVVDRHREDLEQLYRVAGQMATNSEELSPNSRDEREEIFDEYGIRESYNPNTQKALIEEQINDVKKQLVKREAMVQLMEQDRARAQQQLNDGFVDPVPNPEAEENPNYNHVETSSSSDSDSNSQSSDNNDSGLEEE